MDSDPSLACGNLLSLGPYPSDYPRYKKHRDAISKRIRIRPEFKNDAQETISSFQKELAVNRSIDGNQTEL